MSCSATATFSADAVHGLITNEIVGLSPSSPSSVAMSSPSSDAESSPDTSASESESSPQAAAKSVSTKRPNSNFLMISLHGSCVFRPRQENRPDGIVTVANLSHRSNIWDAAENRISITRDGTLQTTNHASKQKSVATRRRLVDAAVEVVRTRGIQGLTLQSVATEAGLSKGGLLYHFSSKEELVTALLHDAMERVDDDLQELVNGDEKGSICSRLCRICQSPARLLGGVCNKRVRGRCT